MKYKTLPYNPAVFFTALLGGIATMIWNQPVNPGVDPPNVNSFRYRLFEEDPEPDGKIYGELHLGIDFLLGQISGTRVNNFLAIPLPEGVWAGYTATIPFLAKNAGGNWELVYCLVSEYQPNLYFRRASEVDWSTQNNLRLSGNLVIETVRPFQL